jgi:hypothetical protein
MVRRTKGEALGTTGTIDRRHLEGPPGIRFQCWAQHAIDRVGTPIADQNHGDRGGHLVGESLAEEIDIDSIDLALGSVGDAYFQGW